jgi:isopenicillin N synthase-like dioxygenase
MAYSDSIPIVEAAALFQPSDLSAKRRIIGEMRAACLNTGMFYVDGHGLPPRILRAVYMCSTGFFSLPAEFKTHVSVNAEGQGYIAARRAVFDSARTTPADEFRATGADGIAGARVKYTGEAVPAAGHADHGAAVMEKYYHHVLRLGSMLLDALSEDGGGADAYRCMAQHPVLYAQLLSRASVSAPPAAPSSCPPQPMVILWRDGVRDVRISGINRMGAVPAEPPGPFAVRVADIMARWSSDLLVCAPHLVLDEAGNEHYRIPVLHDADDDTLVDCVDRCASKGGAKNRARLM